MSYADNLTASLENSRNCLRRIARHDDTEFSHQSILNVMEKFVKSINTMDETILVPCRLMDLKIGDENDPTCTNKKCNNNQKKKNNTVKELLDTVDLFEIYNMLNSVKVDLLWGNQGQTIDENSITTCTNNVVKGHVRRPSTVSVTSTNSSTSSASSTMSDTESDAGVENDSGIEESHDNCDGADRVEQVAHNFRRHLVGLTRSLRQMTETAQYLTTRYQHDIGGAM